MPIIQKITLSRTLDLDIEYLIAPAESDIGHPRSVEIISVSLDGKFLYLPHRMLDGIANEILDIEEV